MSDETKTVQIRWEGPGVKGRGKRRLGTTDGLSRNYEWQGVGSAIDVAHVDAPKIMLLARAGTMAYVAAPADAETLAKEADAMTAPDKTAEPEAQAPEPAKASPAAKKTAEPEAKPDEPEKKSSRTGARRKSAS